MRAPSSSDGNICPPAKAEIRDFNFRGRIYRPKIFFSSPFLTRMFFFVCLAKLNKLSSGVLPQNKAEVEIATFCFCGRANIAVGDNYRRGRAKPRAADHYFGSKIFHPYAARLLIRGQVLFSAGNTAANIRYYIRGKAPGPLACRTARPRLLSRLVAD